MIEIDQQKYGFLFAERLEKTFHEQIRKTIDVEVKLSALLEGFEEEKRKQSELQLQIQTQYDMYLQAVNSVEKLTEANNQYNIIIEEINKTNTNKIEEINNNYSREINNYNNRITDLESELNRTAELRYKFEQLNNEKELKIKDLEREMQRLNEELQITFNDFQILKNSTKEESKKIINKAKKPVVDDGIF